MEKLVYVKNVGKIGPNCFEYKLFYSENPEDVWGIDWDVYGPANCTDLTPDKSTVSSVERLHTSIPFKTVSDISCLSMEYCTHDILALAWIDIDQLEEYPDAGRCVLHFGMEKEKVQFLTGPYTVD